MEISREADGLRFMGECAPEKGFVAGDIQCAGCGFQKTFWAEADMQVYLAENWSRLRQACTHPSVTLHQSTLS